MPNSHLRARNDQIKVVPKLKLSYFWSIAGEVFQTAAKKACNIERGPLKTIHEHLQTNSLAGAHFGIPFKILT